MFLFPLYWLVAEAFGDPTTSIISALTSGSGFGRSAAGIERVYNFIRYKI